MQFSWTAEIRILRAAGVVGDFGLADVVATTI
jgi:hypothetical protein